LETRRGQKIVAVVLGLLLCVGVALLVYGTVAEIDSLAILAYCIVLPVFFALMVNLWMLFAWSDRNK
jgi:hypothetical protein